MLALRNISHYIYNKILRYSSLSSVSMEKPVLYGDEISPPVRFVMMTASILDVDLDFKKIDLFKRENKTDLFSKVNPLQKVPVLAMKDINICDSHAIALYLCQLKNDQELYPEDPILRAKINQLLFFNSSTLFRIDSEVMTKYFAKDWPVDELKLEEWYSALDYLEHHLQENDWLTGTKMRLCDVCIVPVVTSMAALIPFTERHSKVQQWVKRFENLPFYKINKNGVSILASIIEAYK